MIKAIVQINNKQYLVKKDQVLNIELQDNSIKKIELQPLLIIDEQKIEVGMPLAKDFKVKAEVVGKSKADKIKVLKYKAKKRIKKITNHRQNYSQIKILEINKKNS